MVIFRKIQYNISLPVMVFLLIVSSFKLSASEVVNPESLQSAEKPLVITTIKPLAIIAKSALGSSAQVEYLQSAVQSAHEVSLPVSALKKIEQAELIIWIGDGFEARITKQMALLPPTKLITIMELALLSAEPNKEGDSEHRDHRDESEPDIHGHDHHHLSFDPHIWLNPANANILASIIQPRLGLPVTPVMTAEQIDQLKSELAPLKDKVYLTHHDAFAHFTAAFDLQQGLSIRNASGGTQGAKSQYKLRQKARMEGASCIFIEPQYADRDARVIARELELPLTTLDSQGFDQPLNADSYSEFMTGLVAQFKACFE